MLSKKLVRRARILGTVARRRFRQCFKKLGLGDLLAHGFHIGRSAWNRTSFTSYSPASIVTITP